MEDFTSGIAKNWLNDRQRSFWVLNFSSNDLSKAKTPTPNYHHIYIYIYFFSGLRTNHLGRGNHLTKERSRHSVEIKERLRMILGFCYFMNAVAVGFLDFWKVFFWNFGSTKYLGLVYLRFWPSNWRDQDSLQYIYIYHYNIIVRLSVSGTCFCSSNPSPTSAQMQRELGRCRGKGTISTL